MIIVCAMALSAMSFAACGGVSELIPGGANRAPVIEESPGQPGTFLITVYAENGSVIVFETGRGIKQEATVKNSDSITFKAGTGALLPDEPIEGPTCEVAPKIYIKDAFGQERLIENMPTVTLEVPSVTVAYDNPDTVVSEDGTVTISGVIDNSEAELTIGGERVNVGADG